MMNLLKILIVDDDATVRIGLKTLIAWEQYGYRLVGEAANGQQAIEIVHREQPHIIITDMKMPVMDGLTATVEIRKFNKELPIVALTAHAFDSDKAAALEAGCNDYLAKPVDKARLMSVLRKYCYSPDIAL